jgi:hypothetical protein
MLSHYCSASFHSALGNLPLPACLHDPRRYGAAMAVGIACSGTGMREAMALIEPMLLDATDFVQQVGLPPVPVLGAPKFVQAVSTVWVFKA